MYDHKLFVTLDFKITPQISNYLYFLNTRTQCLVSPLQRIHTTSILARGLCKNMYMKYSLFETLKRAWETKCDFCAMISAVILLPSTR